MLHEQANEIVRNAPGLEMALLFSPMELFLFLHVLHFS